jgi:hypothetical protein
MSKTILTIHIDIESERTNEEVLSILSQFEERLNTASIGRFVGSGGGMNQIDVSYLVTDQEFAKKVMEEAFASLGVSAKHSFIAEEFTGDESELFDDIEGVSIAKLFYFFGVILFLFVAFIYIVWNVVVEIRK